MTITYRDTKGSDLTPAEVDANFRHVLSSANTTFTQSGSGAVSGTVQDALRRLFKTLEDFGGSESASATTNTTAFNAAITAGCVLIPYGKSYALNGDVTIPSNRTIWVQKGATLTNTGGRFTAYAVDNVEWIIDGTVASVSLPNGPAKTGWPNSIPIGNPERGFIEFGGDGVTARSGFFVHGTGTVHADWTGTASSADYINQVSRKGIAAWNCARYKVQDLEVYGFRGEAVYYNTGSTSDGDVEYSGLYVHDCEHDGLDINVSVAARSIRVHHNRTVNCLNGIESATGHVESNECKSAAVYGIYFGDGAGNDGSVKNNRVYNSGTDNYKLAFASGGSVVPFFIITGNFSYNPDEYAFNCVKLSKFIFTDNVSIGHAQVASGKAAQFTSCQDGFVGQNLSASPGASTAGEFGFSSCTRVERGANIVASAATSPSGDENTNNLGQFTSLAVTGGLSPSVSTIAAHLCVLGATPRFVLTDSAGAAGSKKTELMFNATSLTGRFTNDDDSAATNWLNVSGTSASITSITLGGPVTATGSITARSGTAIPAGGTAGAGVLVSSTSNFGVFFGSGAPTLSAAKGSLYLRSDGSGTTDRMYVNTNGSTTWTAVTTVA